MIRLLFSIHGVDSLEMEIGINEIIRDNCSERNIVIVLESM